MPLELVSDADNPSAEKLENSPLMFADFWTLYARHEAKKDAEKAWKNLTPTDQMAATVGASDWRRVWAAQGRETQHIPLPASWIRGERWEDELPAEWLSTTHASHAQASLPAMGERTAMPERVRQMLAKLRGKS